MTKERNRRARIVKMAIAALAAAFLVGGTVTPANAAYSVGLSGLNCGSGSFPLPEIHVKSNAYGSVNHFTDDSVHGTMNVFAGSSASYFVADTHHWLRRNMTYGYVKSSSNYTASIKSATRYCI
ncbi:hypothetical protein ACI7YT_10090 [Microbacterium sp. M]|uniref:hypothetical protein n=1 Tax=Microbacterium sp. M TaxID=3377125 RepID=UPI0038672B5E